MTVWISVLGLILGAVIAEEEGAVFGLVLGAGLGRLLSFRRELAALKQAHAQLTQEVAQLAQEVKRTVAAQRAAQATATPAPVEATATPAPVEATATPVPVEATATPVDQLTQSLSGAPVASASPGRASLAQAPPALDVAARANAQTSGTTTTTTPAPHAVAVTTVPPGSAQPRPAAGPRPAPPPSVVEEIFGGALGWLFGGNTVVRVGIVVLLVGVTLLLKYAADHAMFPIELRMASAAGLGIAMVLFGVRQRVARPGFAVTLQGGGIAATYLVVFFAYRVYELLPSGLAFLLLAGIAAGAAGLALAQDAMALVVIGQIGGFAAPVLASSGRGDHVALFSYYLLLNAAIFAIALRRAWRPLNLIGFAFTFGIGTVWGSLKYRPEHFASTEPFLIAFFLLYLAIPVAYAWRNQARGWVDGSLVFGAPLAFLALQRALVDDIPFAMAYTTLALAALYLGLCWLLFRRAPEALRTMAEAFFALAVCFGTLAVPYGLDNAGMTGATWALEGAGAYFLGIRQRRGLSRFAGIALQGLAGIALAIHLADAEPPALPIANTRMLAALLLALGTACVAALAERHREQLPGGEFRFAQALTVWGLLFLVPVGLAEVGDHVPARFVPGATVGWLGLVALIYELAARPLGFVAGRYPAALLVLLWPLSTFAFRADVGEPLIARGGAVGWLMYALPVFLCLRRFVREGPAILRYLHPIALWGAAIWFAVLARDAVPVYLGLSTDWGFAAVAVSLAGALFFTVGADEHSRFPRADCPALYRGLGAAGLFGLSGFWLLYVSGHGRGQVLPLPYLPVINPLDLAQLLGLVAMLAWWRRASGRPLEGWPADSLSHVPTIAAGLSFVWFNSMLARSVHQYTAVSFERVSLFRSVPLQVACSVSWSLIALVLMVWASRSSRRTPWLTGAGLLSVVVVKLFLIDLSRLSTVAKIGTFLVVGLLLLVVGYLAPVPPARASDGGAFGPEPEPEPPPEPATPERAASEAGP